VGVSAVGLEQLHMWLAASSSPPRASTAGLYLAPCACNSSPSFQHNYRLVWSSTLIPLNFKMPGVRKFPLRSLSSWCLWIHICARLHVAFVSRAHEHSYRQKYLRQRITQSPPY
jgi:hypothetical protein